MKPVGAFLFVFFGIYVILGLSKKTWEPKDVSEFYTSTLLTALGVALFFL